MNKIILLGRLTKDVTLNNSNDTNYAHFSIAVDRDRGDEVDFFNCVSFGKQAEALSNYCKKGRQLLVEGRIQMSKIDDKVYYNVVSEKIKFLAQPRSQSNDQPNNNNGSFNQPNMVNNNGVMPTNFNGGMPNNGGFAATPNSNNVNNGGFNVMPNSNNGNNGTPLMNPGVDLNRGNLAF